MKQESYNKLLNLCCGCENGVKEMIKDYGEEVCSNGYDIYDYDGTGLLVIEKVDALNFFEDDYEAIKQAVKDGVKVIPVNEIPSFVPDEMKLYGYIDTPENRSRLFELYSNKDVIDTKDF